MNRWLFIAARNFGDALISRRLLTALVNAHPGDPFTVLTRDAFRSIFRPLDGRVTLVTSVFPMGTMKQFSPAGAWHLMRTIGQLRRNRHDTVVNDRGDVREALLGSLLGARRNVGPVFAPDHPFRRLIRDRGAARWLTDPVPVPAHILGVYEVGEHLAEHLGAAPPPRPQPRTRKPASQIRISIQPFATQECRMWPWEKWRQLILELGKRQYAVTLHGASSDRGILENEFENALPSGSLRIAISPVEEFFRELESATALVALDSFAIHAAHSVNTPAVMINGANDHRLWLPPGTVPVINGGQCPHYPCYCRPVCPNDRVTRFACVHETPVGDVLKALDSILTPIVHS